ncbi:MAG: alpha-amylase [Candidatus Riflebacteria bacterium]|nr:alpha-amylase [Candidatus Riflebacteria bacterium]
MTQQNAGPRIIKHSGAVIVCLIILALLFVSTAQAATRSTGRDVMIQMFGWNSMKDGVPGKWYTLIGEKADELGKMGFTLAWLPPVCRSVSPQGYMPGDYYDLGAPGKPTFYGTKDELTDALKQLKTAGVTPLADIVANHRCAGKQDSNGVWNQYDFPSGLAHWDQSAIVRGEYAGTGGPDSGDNFGPAPDLDHANVQVQQDIIAYMNWLKKLGYGGWRYDFARGYDAKYVAIFDKGTDSPFSVAEYFTDMSFDGSNLNWDQNAHRQRLCDYLNKAGTVCTAFDVTTKGILQVAVQGEYGRLRDKDGKATGLIGWWPERAVTFLDNHDTGSQQNIWPFPHDKVMQGYAYILTHPGIPCVFWEHVYDWNLKTQIKQLMDIRRDYGITSGSVLKIEKAEQGLYAAFIDGRVAVKLGWGTWAPSGPEFKIIASGDQWTVWGQSSRRK